MSQRTIILTSVAKKSFMAMSGILLSLFLLVHALGNSTTFFGRQAFNVYADTLHSLGFFVPVFEVLLLIVFVFHIFIGITLYFQNIQARPSRYRVQKSSGGRTAGSRTMPYTGTLILLFIIIHLWNFHFTEHSITIADLVRGVLANPLFSFFYIGSMIALGLHISHGLWSLFQSLGLNHPTYNTLLRRGALIVTFLLCAVFIMIPLLSLLWGKFLR